MQALVDVHCIGASVTIRHGARINVETAAFPLVGKPHYLDLGATTSQAARAATMREAPGLDPTNRPGPGSFPEAPLDRAAKEGVHRYVGPASLRPRPWARVAACLDPATCCLHCGTAADWHLNSLPLSEHRPRSCPSLASPHMQFYPPTLLVSGNPLQAYLLLPNHGRTPPPGQSTLGRQSPPL